MDLGAGFTVRAIIVYVVAVAVASIMIEGAWGATAGLVAGLSIAQDPAYQQRIADVVKEKGPGSDSARSEGPKAYQNLQQEEKKELMRATKKLLAEVNWFWVTLFASVFVFGLVGFLSGLIARAWLLAGVVPALSFFTNNPIIRFAMARELSIVQKVGIVIVGQFVICYVLAYCGCRVSLKRKEKRESTNEEIKATS